MAKMTNPIVVTLDPEIMDLIRDLRATVDVYVAHTENLIERVYALEGGDAGHTEGLASLEEPHGPLPRFQ